MECDLQVKAFLIPTTSGSTAQIIARYRPSQPMEAEGKQKGQA
ncbi:MAG: hypothetical protein HYY45_03910 [Deltaproteobacteria bacterium]|nr:hypothetical protein [Deltaproteobacteria bacterium]